jgi:hypothetical protein
MQILPEDDREFAVFVVNFMKLLILQKGPDECPELKEISHLIFEIGIDGIQKAIKERLNVKVAQQSDDKGGTRRQDTPMGNEAELN